MSEHRYNAGAYGVCCICGKDLASHLARDDSSEVKQAATIAELEKRIAAFEAHHEEKDALIIGLSRDAQRNAEDARAERQRREDCEAALMRDDETLCDTPVIWARVKAYRSRYPSESDNRTKVAG